MKRKKREGGSCANWLDTYSDMVTLLLTFFVLLFSMTTMNSEKWKKLVTALQLKAGTSPVSATVDLSKVKAEQLTTSSQTASGKGQSSAVSSKSDASVTSVSDFDDLYPYFRNYIIKNNLQDEVGVYKGDGYTFLSFRNSIFFSGDSASLQPKGEKILNFMCSAIAGIPKQIGEIRFYGHTAKVSATDTAERQAFDRGLSADRAKNVLLYVQGKKVIGGEKMVSEGYGEYRPIVKDDGTEATRAKNRRVEIYISKVGKTEDVLEKIYGDINASSSASSSKNSSGSTSSKIPASSGSTSSK